MKEQNEPTGEQVVRPNRPLKYEVYKKTGAFQFRILPAYASQRRDEGCVFVECALATGERKYGFQDRKITIALSVNDIGQVLTGMKAGQVKLIHDPHAQQDGAGVIVKTFEIQSGNPDARTNMPTFFVSATEKKGEDVFQVKIPFAAHEMRILSELLTAALPIILGWV